MRLLLFQGLEMGIQRLAMVFQEKVARKGWSLERGWEGLQVKWDLEEGERGQRVGCLEEL
jgi:hypothetical protein